MSEGEPQAGGSGRRFDWLAIGVIFLGVASARCQLTVWLWRYESAYMLRVSPRGYLVAAPILGLASLGLAMMHKPTRGGWILRALAGLVVMMAMGTAVLKW